MRPAPREKPPQTSPIFISDKVTLGGHSWARKTRVRHQAARMHQVMRPAPREKPPQTSPIFISDKVTLHVSREKGGKLCLGYAGMGRSEGRSAGWLRASSWGGRVKSYPLAGGAMTPPQKLGPPSGPPWFFPAIGAAHVHRTLHFSPSFLSPPLRVTAPFRYA
jgi:hypothetical protein